MTDRSFKQLWGRVDAAPDPAAFVRYMDEVSPRKPHDAETHRIAFELLQPRPGDRLLDVGCGTGVHVGRAARLVGPSGHAVGVDNSLTMVAEARRRASAEELSARFAVTDIYALGFADNAFDGCYALGVFELLDDPRRAIAELARVVRPGGRVVVPAPDLGTWAIDATDRALTRRIVEFISDHELNGWIGRQLPGLFAECGLVEITVRQNPFQMTDYAAVYDLWLRTYVEHARAAAVISASEAAAWLADLRARAEAGRFYLAGLVFIAAGRKPGGS